MQLRLGALAGRGWLIFALGSAGTLAAACDKGEPVASSPATGGGIFGGAGNLDPGLPIAGKGGSGSTSTAGSAAVMEGDCGNVPSGTVALIDNFDDGDNVAAFEPAREAYWFTIKDTSAGTIVPSGDFAPSSDGYQGTRSAHVTASGFTDWGAALVSNISHKEALRCPYNASAFKGLSFVARGSGVVRVQVMMPGVVDKEFGGTCDPGKGQVCYDNHGLDIELTPEFKTYELPWSSFEQRGYGTLVPFDEKTIIALQFAMELAHLPVDLWVDNFEFWDGVPAPSGAAGGAGGETNSAGAGNGHSAGGAEGDGAEGGAGGGG